MKINIYDIIEFSKIYKRVMDIESTMKMRFVAALSLVAKDKKFFRLIPALENPKIFDLNKYKSFKTKRSKNITRNKIRDLISSAQSDHEKFVYLIRIIYLSDLLTLITQYNWLYKNKLFMSEFYCTKVDSGKIDSNKALLCKLRNIIMHFDVKSYKENKEKYIKTLAFWETILHCRNHFIHDLPQIKPTTSNILRQIKDNFPEIFDKSDREIVDIYDDIAFINGLPIERLPLYWTIGRQIYQIKNR